MANTTADKLALAAANKVAIKAAIAAKNPATAPTDVMSQWPTAIASIPSGGGGGEWQPPSDWPNIRDVLDNDTDTTYQHKMICLVDTSLRSKGYGVGDWGVGGVPSRIRFSDGRELLPISWNYSFDFDTAKGRYQWFIAETNADWLTHPRPKYHPYDYIGLLWIYGPNIRLNCYQSSGNQSLQSIEVLQLFDDFEGFVNIEYDSVLENIAATGGIVVRLSVRDCINLRWLPDVLDLSACTNCQNMFSGCYKLSRLPTHVTVNISLSFADMLYDPDRLTEDFDASSVATFDGSGNVVGGFVGNLNTCPNSGQTISFHNNVKALFTADEWTAIKSALAAKNWGCSPA